MEQIVNAYKFLAALTVLSICITEVPVKGQPYNASKTLCVDWILVAQIRTQ